MVNCFFFFFPSQWLEKTKQCCNPKKGTKSHQHAPIAGKSHHSADQKWCTGLFLFLFSLVVEKIGGKKLLLYLATWHIVLQPRRGHENVEGEKGVSNRKKLGAVWQLCLPFLASGSCRRLPWLPQSGMAELNKKEFQKMTKQTKKGKSHCNQNNLGPFACCRDPCQQRHLFWRLPGTRYTCYW